MHKGKYLVGFRLGLGDGVTLERYRAPRGGLHKLHLVHHESGVFVERDYDDSEPVLAVQNDLIGRLQAKLSEKGISWLPARDRDTGAERDSAQGRAAFAPSDVFELSSNLVGGTKLMDLWKHLRAILLLPGVVIVLIPATALALTGLDTFDLWQSAPAIRVVLLVLGCTFICLGLVLMVTTIRLFVTIGKGTLAPWNPTQQLVVQGAFRYVRNPMISGGLFILLGEALLAASLPIFVLFVVFLVVNAIYIPMFEEPGLARRFGDEYLTYKRNVPRWIPRMTAWEAAPMDMRFAVTQATRPQGHGEISPHQDGLRR